MFRPHPMLLLALACACLGAVAVPVAGGADSETSGPDVPCTSDKPVVVPHKDFEEGGLLLSPSSRLLELDRGTVVRRCITLSNRYPDPIRIQLRTTDVKPLSNPDQVYTLAKKSKYGIAGWIEPLVPEIRLEPGDDATIPFRIVVPAEASIGDNYGGLAAYQADLETGPESPDKTGVVTRAQILHFITVRVPGEQKREVELLLDDSPRIISHGSFASFESVYRNRGNVLEEFTAEVALKSKLGGATIDRVKIPPERVYRDSARRLDALWTDVPWIGLYKPELTVRSESGKIVRSYPTILVVPPKWFIGLLAGTLLLAVGGAVVRRRRAWRRYLEDDDDDEFENWGEDGAHFE